MEPIWTDAEVVQVQERLRRVLRTLRHRGHGLPAGVRDAMQRRGLSRRHVAALSVIARDEGLSVGDVAERLGVSLTAASLIVSELNMATVVERVEDQVDRRRTLVYVAERFRPWVRDWLDDGARPIRAALDRLDPAGRAALLDGLDALAEELEAVAPDEPPFHHRHRHRRHRAS